MPVYHFGVAKDHKTQVTLSWQHDWENIAVAYEGQPVGIIENMQALIARQEFALPDGSMLDVQLVPMSKENVLHVVKDGETLNWLDGPLLQPVRLTSKLLHYVGVALIGISPFALLGGFPPNSNVALALIGMFALVLGAVSIYCARRMVHQFSEQAVQVAIGLYIVLLIAMIVSRDEIAFCGAALIVVFILALVWAYRAIHTLNQL